MAWRPDFSANGRPFYLAIADALADDVRRGVVQAGEKLPTQRELAAAMGLDLTTITRAYAEAGTSLIAMGSMPLPLEAGPPRSMRVPSSQT